MFTVFRRVSARDPPASYAASSVWSAPSPSGDAQRRGERPQLRLDSADTRAMYQRNDRMILMLKLKTDAGRQVLVYG